MGFITKLIVVDCNVIIPDRANQQLTVYSLTGETLSQIPCPDLSSRVDFELCAVGADSIVVTDHGLALVFRMSISSFSVRWVRHDVSAPSGVTTYGKDYLLVASDGYIAVLDVNTGMLKNVCQINNVLVDFFE